MVVSRNTALLIKDLLGSLNPKGWPFKITDLPVGSALVGGSVRDGLLNKFSQKPDLDFVIPKNAIQFTEHLSKQINATHIKLDENRDIARIVVDGWTLDFASQVGGSLEADLLSRDYRINAIALTLEKEPQLIDPTGGIEDLNSKKIVAISEKNLVDDPLRILRGFRFMCDLNFDLDEKTKIFLKNNVYRIKNVAPERIKTEILKIVNSEWHHSVWRTYLELELLKNWQEDNFPSLELNINEVFSEELLEGRSLARLICFLSDEGLSKLKFSKNQIKRCKNLRFWVRKINNCELENLTEEERFQLHSDLEEDLPSLILFLNDKYVDEWLERWRDASDPLFHPCSPIDGHLLQEAVRVPPGPYLGDLMRHLAKEKAFGGFFTNQEALEVARKWTLENSPFL